MKAHLIITTIIVFSSSANFSLLGQKDISGVYYSNEVGRQINIENEKFTYWNSRWNAWYIY